MKTKLDINNWNRKEIFDFFKGFSEPFYGLTVDIDCTIAYDFCKKNNISFFLFYLHRSLIAVNKIENFKYRIIAGEVYVYDKVNASPTINRPNGTFGFSYMAFYNEFSKFEREAKLEIERVQATTTLIPATSSENVIHYSSIPWIKFSALSHARHFEFEDSCPKISFGKMTDNGNKKEMPMSIHAHHALIDGSHIGEYINLFQELLNNTSL
ncbi:CatA-like O-acetyltransferase [Tenacibaculum xiamenense]|uniref:CatA-like O-acetyltransferase n=1 Tax=Tenacibaculum xiamenense TaxID=1261553 RepID=UPI003894CD56